MQQKLDRRTMEEKTIEVGTLYDLNKQIISQLPEMPQEQIQEQLFKIKEWIAASDTNYIMLLCREKADYTLFHFCGRRMVISWEKDIPSNTIKALEECIKNRGILMSINKATEDAWEIWIKDFFDKEIHMYMLFECGQMVIEI